MTDQHGYMTAHMMSQYTHTQTPYLTHTYRYQPARSTTATFLLLFILNVLYIIVRSVPLHHPCVVVHFYSLAPTLAPYLAGWWLLRCKNVPQKLDAKVQGHRSIQPPLITDVTVRSRWDGLMRSSVIIIINPYLYLTMCVMGRIYIYLRTSRGLYIMNSLQYRVHACMNLMMIVFRIEYFMI